MIRNKKIVITGGSSGLGLALADRLAEHNELLLIARNEKKIEKAVNNIRSQAKNARVVGCSIDVTDKNAKGLLLEATDKFGGVDLLINSAGILREGYFESLSEKDFEDTLQINFFGSVNTIRTLLPQLKRSQGKIVNIASIAGLTGVFGYSAYCSSKHALIGFTESLHFELAHEGVQVQVVCPPEFDSPMVDALDEDRSPENKAHTRAIPKLSIDACTDDVLRGISGSQFMIIPGRQSKLMALGLRYFPSVSRWVGERRIGQARKKLRPVS